MGHSGRSHEGTDTADAGARLSGRSHEGTDTAGLKCEIDGRPGSIFSPALGTSHVRVKKITKDAQLTCMILHNMY